MRGGGTSVGSVMKLGTLVKLWDVMNHANIHFYRLHSF
jgi:hypothetical protein